MKKTLIALLFIVSAVALPVMAADNANMVLNGDFSVGNSNWWDYKNDTGAYKVSAADKCLKIDITDPGSNPWSIGVGQGDLNLEKDTVYTVKFSIKGNLPKPVRLLLSMANAPYLTYSGTHVYTLTPDFKEYTFSFTMNHPTDAKSNIVFQVGKAGTGSVYINNVSVVKAGPKKEEVILKDFPAPFAKEMKRGLNFGNTLDAPVEGEWGQELRGDYFDIIKKNGNFDTVRIPCRWETRCSENPPYTIDPAFMRHVEWAVSQALSRGFYVVLNMHHHLTFENEPVKQKERWLSMWKQIAEHFKDYPANLKFEIYNEPGTHLSDKAGTLEQADIWNSLWPEAYRVIRQSNPTRDIVISGPHWANVDSLLYLEVPADIEKDPDKIIQFHFYYPVDFCLQGANGSGFENSKGIRWGSDIDKDNIKYKFYVITKWAKEHNYRLWNGEFSCFGEASVPADRFKWINYVVTQCEKNNIPWCFWDFAGDVGKVYDPDANEWNPKLLKALTKPNGL